MRRKGYIYSLFVFLIFISVFLIAITNVKSVSVMQESNYDKITIMKISNVARNVVEISSSVSDCNELKSELESANLPFDLDVECLNSRVTLTSKSGDYTQIISI